MKSFIRLNIRYLVLTVIALVNIFLFQNCSNWKGNVMVANKFDGSEANLLPTQNDDATSIVTAFVEEDEDDEDDKEEAESDMSVVTTTQMSQPLVQITTSNTPEVIVVPSLPPARESQSTMDQSNSSSSSSSNNSTASADSNTTTNSQTEMSLDSAPTSTSETATESQMASDEAKDLENQDPTKSTEPKTETVASMNDNDDDSDDVDENKSGDDSDTPGPVDFEKGYLACTQNYQTLKNIALPLLQSEIKSEEKVSKCKSWKINHHKTELKLTGFHVLLNDSSEKLVIDQLKIRGKLIVCGNIEIKKLKVKGKHSSVVTVNADVNEGRARKVQAFSSQLKDGQFILEKCETCDVKSDKSFRFSIQNNILTLHKAALQSSHEESSRKVEHEHKADEPAKKEIKNEERKVTDALVNIVERVVGKSESEGHKHSRGH